MNALNMETLSFAHTLCDSAGEILRTYFRKTTAIEHKADNSPVTEADKLVEHTLREMIVNTYPEHGVYGEEHARINDNASLQWVIDPIDGTRAFIAGYPIFTTLIALTENGVPVLGIIDQPILKERWVGIKGEATTLNDSPVHTRQTIHTVSSARMATTSMAYFNDKERDQYRTIKRQSSHSIHGGDAYAYAMLAGGQLDMVIDAQMKPYDFCALVPVVEGAGGMITDWEGNPITIHSQGHILASACSTLHHATLPLLN